MKKLWQFSGCVLLITGFCFHLNADIAAPIQSCWYQGKMAQYNLGSPLSTLQNTQDVLHQVAHRPTPNLLGALEAHSSDAHNTAAQYIMMHYYQSKNLSLAAMALGVQMSVKFH